MRGAPGNSDGTRRTRAGTSCDPMRRTRKETGRPTSADGIDTVTGTMPRRPLLSPCSDGRKANGRRVRGRNAESSDWWSASGKRCGRSEDGRLSRPIITGDGFIEPGVARFHQSYGLRAFRSVSGAPGPRVDGAGREGEASGLVEGGRPSKRKPRHGTDRTPEILSAGPGGEVRSRGHEFD